MVEPVTVLTHLDLFSGIGGFALAAKWAGFNTIAFCEIDKACRAVLQKHWPNTPIFKDVRMLCRRIWMNKPMDEGGYVECSIHTGEYFGDCPCIGTDQFTDDYGWPTLITAGFPCQDISNAGKSYPGGCKGLKGKHSGLWTEASRIIDQLRSDYVVVENVPAILTRGHEQVIFDLEMSDYQTWTFIYDVAATGGQIKRSRAFILGIQKSKCERLQRYVGEIMERARERRQNPDFTRSDYGCASPEVFGESHGVSGSVDRIRQLGNALNPNQALPILQAIAELERQQ